MRGRKLKLSRRQKQGRKERRQPSSSFRIIRPDTGYTAHDMTLGVGARCPMHATAVAHDVLCLSPSVCVHKGAAGCQC